MSSKEHNNPWKTLSSKTVYENPWIAVVENQVITPAGKPGIYGVVRPKIAAGVFAIDNKGFVTIVGQYRYPTDEYSWEIIKGGVEKNEPPIKGAERELAEEAGIKAGSIIQLGNEIHLSNCFTDEVAFCFLATNLSEIESSPEETEVLEIKKIHIDELVDMYKNGLIKCALSIITITRALEYLKVK